MTPNPIRNRLRSTITTTYSPNARHRNPLVSAQERPRPSVPPGSGSSTAACTATERPHATILLIIPGIIVACGLSVARDDDAGNDQEDRREARQDARGETGCQR